MTELIGGEMLSWSDLDGRHGPRPAGGPVPAALLGTLTGRTLIAGPHDPALIDAVPAGPITLLVRGVADADALTARYASRPGVTICCGSLEKLPGAYDSVLALDGLDRLHSAEADDRSWDETLTQVLALLRPGGRLMLTVENLFGLHRLTGLPAEPDDTDWVVSDDHDPSRPASPERLRARLAAAGVPVVRDYAVYPAPGSTELLLGGEVLTDPALRGYLEARLGRVLAPDAARLATGALRHDLAGDLAPAWLLLAGDLTAGPAALVGGEELHRTAAGWTLGPSGVAVPLGRTLEDLLLGACRRRALPAVRDLLTAWQEGAAAGVPADRIVVDTEGDLHGLAPAGPPVQALRRFAARVLAAGYAHLWPSPVDEPTLTALLAGMTGRELDPATIGPAAERPEPSRRELAVTVERLERELAEARAQSAFLERTVVSRDLELKRLRQINALITATTGGKAANTLVGGLKAVRRAVRKARG